MLKIIGQCDVKHIMTLPIKTIMSFLRSWYTLSLVSQLVLVRLSSILVIMSVSTFKSTVILCLRTFVIDNLCNIHWQGFVIFVTMCREALDDCRRYRRDKEANSQRYKKLTRDGLVTIPSSDIKVGDLIQVEKVMIIKKQLILFLCNSTE